MIDKNGNLVIKVPWEEFEQVSPGWTEADEVKSLAETTLEDLFSVTVVAKSAKIIGYRRWEVSFWSPDKIKQLLNGA